MDLQKKFEVGLQDSFFQFCECPLMPLAFNLAGGGFLRHTTHQVCPAIFSRLV